MEGSATSTRRWKSSQPWTSNPPWSSRSPKKKNCSTSRRNPPPSASPSFFFQAEDGIRDLIVTGVSDVCSSDLGGTTLVNRDPDDVSTLLVGADNALGSGPLRLVTGTFAASGGSSRFVENTDNGHYYALTA